jgi:hypothetical protein
MEKIKALNIGMDISDVSTVLGEEIILEKRERKDTATYYLYENLKAGFSLHFSDDKKLYSIYFKDPFSLPVDGIKIGMEENEVKEIRGEPESTTGLEELNIDYWFYDNETTLYAFEEGKLSSILKAGKMEK